MSDRRTEIAQLVGIDPRAFRDLKASLVDALVRKGVLVSLHIGRWRARHKLDPEDLGLDPRGRSGNLSILPLRLRGVLRAAVE